jgi:hypothetical protein
MQNSCTLSRGLSVFLIWLTEDTTLFYNAVEIYVQAIPLFENCLLHEVITTEHHVGK